MMFYVKAYSGLYDCVFINYTTPLDYWLDYNEAHGKANEIGPYLGQHIIIEGNWMSV